MPIPTGTAASARELTSQPGPLDAAACYAALLSRDRRFDGRFVTAVVTTGIYCRPSCPALTPAQRNVRFHRTAAAAQAAGFRACKRCRPDATPGSPDWDVRADLVGRAVRLVEDGVVDREGVDGLAGRLGYSSRQLRRHLSAELGVGPLALARAQRAQTARTLLESTDLPIVDIAFAAGFGSVRQCNDTVREVYASAPRDLRRSRDGGVTPGEIRLRLPYREPNSVSDTLEFLAAHAVPGVEDYDGHRYARSLRLPFGSGVVSLAPADGHVLATLWLTDLRDVGATVARCRRLLDLDADPLAVDCALGAEAALAPLVARWPGRRMPGAVDGDEAAARTLIGQQVSLSAARTLGGRLTQRYGTVLAQPVGAVTHLFPTAAALANADPAELPMPQSRARALVGLSEALATGGLVLDPGADRDETESILLALPGVGPWTARYLRMRVLGDPDVLLAEDLALRRVAPGLGLPGDLKGLQGAGRSWAPWRSYATGLLWARALEMMTTKGNR